MLYNALRTRTLRRSILALGLACPPALTGQASQWTLYEKTNISGTISGVVQMGHIFKTISGNYYEVAEPIIEVVVEVMPAVTVLRKGDLYRLIIDGFDDPIICTKLGSAAGDSTAVAVIESRLDGDSDGFDGETVFKLRNGQIWIQTDGYYRYRYKYAPQVLIYRDAAGYKLKLEGIERAVRVQRLR